MDLRIRLFCLAIVPLIFTSCSSWKLADGSRSEILMAVSSRFGELKQSGKFSPYVEPGSHVQMTGMSIPRDARAAVLHVVADDQSRYSFTFGKQPNSSQWYIARMEWLRPDGTRESLKRQN
jgi:hypothetical protein